MKPFKRQQFNTPERRRVQRADDSLESDAFRRGRTLTGSASSSVRTLSEKKADLKSPRVQVHELKQKRRQTFFIFVTVCIVALGVFTLTSQFTARPIVQASPDTSLRLESVYADSIDDYLTSRMSERLRPLTNIDQLTAHVQAVAPEVQSIKLKGSVGVGESLFEITFREPIASWSVDGQQLYVDASGNPFARNYFATPTLRISDQSGMVALSGQTVMSNRFMSFIGQVIGLSQAQGYVVTDIEIPEGMTRQVDVRLDGVEYPFRFSSDRPAGEGVEDMVRTLQWMRGRQLSPQYVDVRVGGRAFYR